jgi:predicted TIM-barrel fold metal-dependent hydrolase
MNSLFASIPITDSHVHFVHLERMNEMLALMDAVPCTRFNLVCIPNPDATTHNPAALCFKQHHPDRTYISGALDYTVLADLDHAPELLGEQIAGLKARGFDGLKLIEGKPQVRKLLPHPLDGPLYTGMWAALEREQFPVVFHVNDPDEFWDKDRCPDWARQSGWDYSDGGYPSKEDFYAEVDNILTRHPDLKIIFAHFYFLSRDLEHAARFLDSHPDVCFDLAPHIDMYRDFSRDPEAARAFFVRYQDRIIYGTDTDTRALVRGPEGVRFMQSIPLLIRSFLETDGKFAMLGGEPYHGLGLQQNVLEKIYHINFERIYGESPALLKNPERRKRK